MGIDESRRRIFLRDLVSEYQQRFRISKRAAAFCVSDVIYDATAVTVYRVTDTSIERISDEDERFSFLEAAFEGIWYDDDSRIKLVPHVTQAHITCALDEEIARAACQLAAPSDGGATAAFKDHLPRSKLRPLIETWASVQTVLGVRRLQAVTFVENVVKAEQIPLYLCDDFTGLWRRHDYGAAVEQLIDDLGTSDFAQSAEAGAGEWGAYRVLPSDFEKIIGAAQVIVGHETDAQKPRYLNPEHPRYAPKLAAAVRAWLAVENPKGKHPKQALQSWLREHAAEFDLVDAQGKPNEQGIEECAKVANWQPVGGAPKTPG